MLEQLRKDVNDANNELLKSGLIRLSWGSVSGIDRKLGFIAITPEIDDSPSSEQEIVLVDISGKTIKGKSKPSRDMLTHIELYKKFPELGGITHTHSVYATIFAQANKKIERFGTMHNDYFADTINITPEIPSTENHDDYAKYVGKIISNTISPEKLMENPGILIQGDGPVTWGKTPFESVRNAKAIEAIAEIAFGTSILNGL